ncbi:MAG: HEAT repeat domain-containing protein, partial [Thermoguttaceae bacterium]
ETLKSALKSDNAEVRFYAAESLAYLNDVNAARPLTEIARNEPAFRAYALAALGTMQNDIEAKTGLKSLLNENSAETRYGAFRALWFMDPNDLTIRGDNLGNNDGYAFSYHVLNTSGSPMVHITNSKRAEVVIFGSDLRLVPNFILDAGISILVRSTGPDEVVVTRQNPYGGLDERRTVSTQLDEIIRAVVDLGGTYPDIVQLLMEASEQKALPCKLEIDKVPTGGRVYSRKYDDEYAIEDEPVKKKSTWSKLSPTNWFSADQVDDDEDYE